MEEVLKFLGKSSVVAVGIFYLWGLLPIGMRPQLTSSPLTKATETITLATLVGPEATGRIHSACSAPWLLRPIEHSAKMVRVLIPRGAVLEVHDVRCDPNAG